MSISILANKDSQKPPLDCQLSIGSSLELRNPVYYPEYTDYTISVSYSTNGFNHSTFGDLCENFFSKYLFKSPNKIYKINLYHPKWKNLAHTSTESDYLPYVFEWSAFFRT